MNRLFLVAHTHWDREWHKTYEENRVRLIGFMQDLLDGLEHDPNFCCFVLDGQTSLLLDYLDVCPDEEDRLRTLVQQGRLAIGPWFVQPDVNIPSSEALLRNLLISKNISDRFGPFMRVGYLPDSFGMSADMPTLLCSFGIDSALFYRGLSKDDLAKDAFYWRGLDGSEVMTGWMPDGYGNAMFLPPSSVTANEQIEALVQARQERSIANCFLLMSGSDQCYAKKHLAVLCKEIANQYDIQLCTPRNYLDAVARKGLEVFEGEMRRGRHSRTHVGIAATRMDIKKLNYEADAKYKYLLEPLCSIAALWGISYPQASINRGWRYIVENHAHDSICCCCTDAVHREMVQRLNNAVQIADTIIANTYEAIHNRIRYDKDRGRPLLLFSSSPTPRRELVSATLYLKSIMFTIKDNDGCTLPYIVHSVKQHNLRDTKVSLSPIPDDFYHCIEVSFYAQTNGLGYTTCYICEDMQPDMCQSSSMLRGQTLENEYLRCTVLVDGSLNVFDKIENREYQRQHIFVDGGNAGDEYDFSPPVCDRLIDSTSAKIRVGVLEDTPLCASLEIAYELTVPACMAGKERSSETVALRIKTKVSLGVEDRFLDFVTTVDNCARDHRLQVLFDIGEIADTHIADVQLGELKRENSSALTEVSENDIWAERYYPIYTQQKYVAVQNALGHGLMIANHGVPQYEIVQGSSTRIALTLVSSVGHMGNKDLRYRHGRRSGALCPTPDSQLQCTLVSSYRLFCLSPQTRRAQLGEQYCNPIVAKSYAEYECAGIMPDEFYALCHDGELSLKAFKQGETGDGFVARFVNPSYSAVANQRLDAPPYLFKGCHAIDSSEQSVKNEQIQALYTINPDASDPYIFNGGVTIEQPAPHTLLGLKFIT